jgi:hypothetical protein
VIGFHVSPETYRYERDDIGESCSSVIFGCIYKNKSEIEKIKSIACDIRLMIEKDKNRLDDVKKLFIGNGLLPLIPKEIGSFKNLESLDISSSCLDLPVTIGALSNLKKLDLRSWYLKKIPDSITKLKNLESFKLNIHQLVFVDNHILEFYVKSNSNAKKFKKFFYNIINPLYYDKKYLPTVRCLINLVDDKCLDIIYGEYCSQMNEALRKYNKICLLHKTPVFDEISFDEARDLFNNQTFFSEESVNDLFSFKFSMVLSEEAIAQLSQEAWDQVNPAKAIQAGLNYVLEKRETAQAQ